MKALGLLMLLLAACGNTDASPPAAKVAPPTNTHRISCDAEVALLCPDGYEDGCIGNRTTSKVCVKKELQALSPCETEIAVLCADGEINSCYAKPPYGTRHICVKN